MLHCLMVIIWLMMVNHNLNPYPICSMMLVNLPTRLGDFVRANVGKYTSTMEHMGNVKCLQQATQNFPPPRTPRTHHHLPEYLISNVAVSQFWSGKAIQYISRCSLYIPFWSIYIRIRSHYISSLVGFYC